MSIEAFQKQKPIIEKRMAFMDGLEASGNYYMERQLASYLLLRMLEWTLIGGTKFTGQENVNLALQKIDEGDNRLTLAANHTSDTDHSAFEHAFHRNGFGRLAKILLFPSGLKMWDRPDTKWAMRGMNVSPVPAPGYFDEVRDFEQLPLSDADLNMLLEYQEKMRMLGKKSMEKLIPDWKKGKVVPFFYPEATRSKDDLIGRGREETEAYFRHGYTLPLQIEGPGTYFPPNRELWETLKTIAKIALTREFIVEVKAGELISNRRLQAPDIREWLKERKATKVDFVMS